MPRRRPDVSGKKLIGICVLLAVGLWLVLSILRAGTALGREIREQQAGHLADPALGMEVPQGREPQAAASREGQDVGVFHASFFAPTGTVNASQFS